MSARDERFKARNPADRPSHLALSRFEWGIIGIAVTALLIAISLDLLAPSGGTQAVVVLPRIAILNSPFAIAIALTIFWVVVGSAGYVEWRNHLKRLESIPIRIHVNGSRGKTGTSRLIGAALRAN